MEKRNYLLAILVLITLIVTAVLFFETDSKPSAKHTVNYLTPGTGTTTIERHL